MTTTVLRPSPGTGPEYTPNTTRRRRPSLEYTPSTYECRSHQAMIHLRFPVAGGSCFKRGAPATITIKHKHRDVSARCSIGPDVRVTSPGHHPLPRSGNSHIIAHLPSARGTALASSTHSVDGGPYGSPPASPPRACCERCATATTTYSRATLVLVPCRCHHEYQASLLSHPLHHQPISNLLGDP